MSDANIDESPFSFTLPEGWRTVEGELYLDDPSISTYQELTVSSGPIEAEASRRCVLPVAAVEQLGPHDAFVSIRTGQTSVFFVKERPPVDEMMPEDVFPSQWIDLCLSRPTEILFSETGFQQEGKPFVVYVGIGPEASGERINEVRAVLESLVIS